MFYQYPPPAVRHVLQILGAGFLSGCCSNDHCLLRSEYVFIICIWVCLYECVTNDQSYSYCLQTSMRTCYSKKRTLFPGTFILSRTFSTLYDLKSRAAFWVFFVSVLFCFSSDVPGQQMNLVLMKSLDALEDCCFDTSLEYKWVSFITDYNTLFYFELHLFNSCFYSLILHRRV